MILINCSFTLIVSISSKNNTQVNYLEITIKLKRNFNFIYDNLKVTTVTIPRIPKNFIGKIGWACCPGFKCHLK